MYIRLPATQERRGMCATFSDYSTKCKAIALVVNAERGGVKTPDVQSDRWCPTVSNNLSQSRISVLTKLTLITAQSPLTHTF